MPFDSAPEIKPNIVADIADAAADLLERDGWCQFAATDNGSRRCLTHALGTAVYNEKPCLPINVDWAYFTIALRLMGFETHNEAARWNDDASRTKDEVIAKLRSVRRCPQKESLNALRFCARNQI